MKACPGVLAAAVAMIALTVLTPRSAPGQKVTKDRRITLQQPDEILSEAKRIRVLSEKMEKGSALRGAGSLATEEHVKVRIAEGYSIGAKDAPVTLVEFADYECPFCKQFHTTTFHQLRENYVDTGKLRFVALDLPLIIHGSAMKAAEAALCAGEQSKFWEMRDLLLTNRTNLTEDTMLSFALKLQLDFGPFQTCLRSGRYITRINAEIAEADSAGIAATPSFVLGKTAEGQTEGIKIVGTPAYYELDSKIKELLGASDEPRDPLRPNLLIITLDTTRADHLGCYGMKEAKTPVLDTLASRGALLEEAHTHVPLTLPSHAVLLTGQLPSSLNLRVNGLRLNEGVETLTTHLKARGYWTGAVVATAILNREYGLARGFAAYDDNMTLAPSGGGSPEERGGMEVTEAALKLVKGIKGPFFLWVHYYDPHYEYRPPEPYAREFLKNLYDGEIAYMDASIGKLLDGLRREGFLDNTLIAVAGDHGEGLMEHGERQHGIFLYEYALHVPLFLVWEGHIRPGLRIRGVCGLDDVAPTVLDLMSQGSLLKTDGLSLKLLLDGGTTAARSLYAESYHGFFTYGWAPLRAIITEQWKFIEAPRPELYQWRISEDRNLYADGRPEARVGRKDLLRYPPAEAAEGAQMESLLKDPNSEETLRMLMSFGYFSVGGVRLDRPGLLDPKDAIGIEEDLTRAKESLDTGDVQKGTQTLTSVLQRNPQNVPALSMLGLTYLNISEYEKAKACFQEEIRLRPQLETARSNLGTVYKRMGKTDLAMQEYKAALVISPRHAVAAANLAQIYLNKDLVEEARRVMDSTLTAGGESADLYFEMGVLEARSSNWDKARVAFTKVVSLDPRRGEAYVNLGKIAYNQGRVDESIYQYQRALRLAPGNASYLATIGSLYFNGKNDLPQALRYFRQALAADPYGPNAQSLRDLIQGLQAQGVR